GLLEIAIEGQRERAAGEVGDLPEHADPAAEGVDLHLLASRRAAQVLVERLLEARLADQVALQVAAVSLGELVLAHLADVAEKGRGEWPEGIVPLRRDAERDAGKVELVCLQRDHGLPVDVTAEQDPLVALAFAGRAHGRVDPRLLLSQIPGERL